MISKELLSEVLGRKVIEVSDLQYANNCLNICGEEGIFLGAYNIHELANKVKKWSLIKKGFSMNVLLFTEDY